jgi:ABC-type branched-subunit amino acid transport system ATPase component
MTALDDVILRAENLHKRFGGIQALQGVSMDLRRGAVLGVIGPNGSGKTTLTNAINGAHRPDTGQVTLDGVDVTRLRAHRRASLGLARTFQNPHVFASLTVRQNMVVAVAHRSDRRQMRALADDVEKWLAAVGLEHMADRVAHELSGGQQKLVEFARAMVNKPAVVLMDEPFAGVHPHIKQTLHRLITEHAATGAASFMIVSHEVPDLVALSDRLLCVAGGRVLADDIPDTVCADPRVIEAYLGAPSQAGAA